MEDAPRARDPEPTARVEDGATRAHDRQVPSLEHDETAPVESPGRRPRCIDEPRALRKSVRSEPRGAGSGLRRRAHEEIGAEPMDGRGLASRERPEGLGVRVALDLQHGCVQFDGREDGSGRIERDAQETPVRVADRDRCFRARDAGQRAAREHGLDPPVLPAEQDAIRIVLSGRAHERDRRAVAAGSQTRARRQDLVHADRARGVEAHEPGRTGGRSRGGSKDPRSAVGPRDDGDRPIDGDPPHQDQVVVQTVERAAVAIRHPELDRSFVRFFGDSGERETEGEQRSRSEQTDPARIPHALPDRARSRE